MRRGVADDLKAVGILVGDDRELGVVLDEMGGVDKTPLDLAGKRGTGQAGADGGGNLGNRHWLFEAANRTVGQGDVGHDGSRDKFEGKKKVRPGRTFFSTEKRLAADQILLSLERCKFETSAFSS